MRGSLEKATVTGGVARIGAIFLTIVGALFTILSLLGFLGSGQVMTPGGLILIGALGLALLVSGVIWLRRQGEVDVTAQNAEEERMVMHLAAKRGGTLTLPQVVQDTSLSTTEAEALLERLTSRRLFELDLLDDGTVLYRLRGEEAPKLRQ